MLYNQYPTDKPVEISFNYHKIKIQRFDFLKNQAVESQISFIKRGALVWGMTFPSEFQHHLIETTRVKLEIFNS